MRTPLFLLALLVPACGGGGSAGDLATGVLPPIDCGDGGGGGGGSGGGGSGGTTPSTVSMGSFVNGERPMYLEIDQFADDQSFTVEFMNAPSDATEVTLYLSDRIVVATHPDPTTPGYFGIDLNSCEIISVSGTTYQGIVDGSRWNGITYIQGYLSTPRGGRLTSLVECHPDEALTTPPSSSIVFPIPLTTQEVLRPGRAGIDVVAQPVRVGVPLPPGQVFENGFGVPNLTLTGGATAGQFSTLARWDDGSCKWVLCEYLASLAAGATDNTVQVDKGSGSFGGAWIASTDGTLTTIDTGAMTVTIDSTVDDLFQSIRAGGLDLLSTAAGNRPHFWDAADAEWTWHKSKVTTRRNGPVRAEVEIDGSFTRTASPTDADRIYVRFYVEANQGESELRVTASLRDTSLQFPEHLLFRGFTYQATLNELGPFDVRMPAPALRGDSTTLNGGAIGSGQDAEFRLGYVSRSDYRLQTDSNSTAYFGFIQRNGVDLFAIEGVRERIGSTEYCGDAASGWFSAENELTDPSFLEVTSSASGRGVLFGIEHACRTWPVGLAAVGDGAIEVGLLPRKVPSDPHSYPLPYASAETRVFYLSFESAPASDPIAVATTFDYPLAARAALFAYNQSQVWPWKLVDEAQFKTYQNLAGIRATQPDASDPIRTVFRFAGETGGANNNWEETRRFYHWLRTGHGGSYLHSFFEAQYKADKMAWNIDDGALEDRQKVRNANAQVTRKSDMYDGSKHTFFQAVPDWAFTRGETPLLDSAKALSETILSPAISPNVQPYGNFVLGTYSAVTTAAMAALDLAPNAELEAWLRTIMYQWANVVFKQPNGFGVDTGMLGWQAPVGTPVGSATNLDGYMITWAAGKSSDKALYGYMSQQWTDLRGNAQAFHRFIHYRDHHAPGDPLVTNLLQRAPDLYHYARRGILDDHNRDTGDYYITDVFAGDGGNPNPPSCAPPGYYIDEPSTSAYANQSIINLLLEWKASETAYSYGVEMNRSMAEPTYQSMASDPILNDFVWRYLVHYGLLQP